MGAFCSPFFDNQPNSDSFLCCSFTMVNIRFNFDAYFFGFKMTSTQQRALLQRQIWQIANEVVAQLMAGILNNMY
jgi:hypothetical protein